MRQPSTTSRNIVDITQSISSQLNRQFGITNEGYLALAQEYAERECAADFELLLQTIKNFKACDLSFIQGFKTKLWTLLGEIGTPDDLGQYMPKLWPILIFPSGAPYITKIRGAIAKYGARAAEEIPVLLNMDIHAQLYGGQQWYPALRAAFQKSLDEFSSTGFLIWMAAADDSAPTLATIARKLQLQVRPALPEIRIKCQGNLYPGIQRAFHTPRLDNVAIHSLILDKIKNELPREI